MIYCLGFCFYLYISNNKKQKENTMPATDSRTSSILINLNLNISSGLVASNYSNSVRGIEEAKKGDKIKSYKNLRSTLKECYLTGSLKYGNNFIM